jgi:hypothetical protein
VNQDMLLAEIKKIIYKDGALDGREVVDLRQKLKDLDRHLSEGGKFPRLWVTQKDRAKDSWFCS